MSPRRRPSWLPRLAALLPSLALLWPALGHASGALHADGQFLRDAQGGAVLLRGVDVTGDAKVPPFTPLTNPALLDPLPTWGMNVLRLLFIWEAYEPVQGQYDDSYLAYIRSVIEAADARGLWVVVDFHQDAYSRFALEGCGDGFPAWTLPPDQPQATPDNGPDCSDWGRRWLGDAGVTADWNAFYSDSNGARQAYLTMINRVAAALAGEHAVLGYDMLNEPGGDELSQLLPLYTDAAMAIRSADPDAILFVGPGATTSAGIATTLTKPPFDNFVFAPHFYDPTVVVALAYKNSDEHIEFDQLAAISSQWNVPLFLGEIGAPPAVENIDGYMTTLYRQLGATLASGVQWVYTPGWTATAKDGWNTEDFSIVDGTGAWRANFRTRPYARRVAGTPTAVTLADNDDRAQSRFVVSWQNDPAAGATELYLPSDWFGGKPSVDGDGDVRCTLAGAIASCRAASAGAKTVTVTKASSRCGLTGAEALLVALVIRRRRRATSSA